MRLLCLSLLYYFFTCFSDYGVIAGKKTEQLYFKDCRSSSTLDSQTVCKKGIKKHDGLDKCWHSIPSSYPLNYEAHVYISSAQPSSGTHYNWFIGIFDAQMEIEAVNYKTRTEGNLQNFCRMCYFDVLYKVRSLDRDDPFIKCATHYGEYFVEKRIECAAIATAIKIVNKKLGDNQYLEICELSAYGIKDNGGEEELEEVQISQCQRSFRFNDDTDCEKAIDNKRDDCRPSSKIFITPTQGEYANNHWFKGYFNAIVNLYSILYVAGDDQQSRDDCRMCHFTVEYRFLIYPITHQEEFSQCSKYDEEKPFKSKLLKCKAKTNLIRIVNQRGKDRQRQYLEICEITAFGKLAATLNNQWPRAEFSTCDSSETDDGTRDCKKAIDGKYGDCVTRENVFVSAPQENELNEGFTGHWFIGRFGSLVLLNSLVYQPRIADLEKCGMCEFELWYKVPFIKTSETFEACIRTTLGKPDKRLTLECQRLTDAVKLVNKAVSSPSNPQRLEICELIAYGVTFEKDLQTVEFRSCRPSSTLNKKTICKNAVDGKYSNCAIRSDIFMSTAQGEKSRGEFYRNWFIGRFYDFVQLESLIYYPSFRSGSTYRSWNFTVSFLKRENDEFQVCNTIDKEEDRTAFTHKLIKCPCTTKAVKFLNNLPSIYREKQYLEICELIAIGVEVTG